MQRDSIANTFVVATSLCVVCSVLVSTAAVALRPYQEENKRRERKRNILVAAGIYDPAQPLDQQYEQRVEAKLVNLDTGEFVDSSIIDPTQFDQRAAARDPELSVAIPEEEDVAKIRRRSKYAFVYVITKDGVFDQMVLPIHGKGLWSTMYGFLALDTDLNTVRGITFYEHGETPGLGGEIESESFKKNWKNKQVYGSNGEVELEVIRGSVDSSSEHAKFEVDGIAGATITSRGVSQLIHYWLDEDGFEKFLESQRAS